MRPRLVAFDWGHTLVDERADAGIPLAARPIHRMPGVPTALAPIPLPMAVWANSREPAKAIRGWLGRAGLDAYFAHVVSSADIGCRKPDPRFFAAALAVCGIAANEVLFVGNQLDTDVRGACDAGIACVWLSGAVHRSDDERGVRGAGVEPTFAIAGLDELPALVARLLAR